MESGRRRLGSAAAVLVVAMVASVVLAGGPLASSSVASKPGLVSLKGTWEVAQGQMTDPRFVATTVLLPDGRVLIIGGRTDYGHSGPHMADNVDVFDPKTGTVSYSGRLAGDRNADLSALLPDGRVLLVGGTSCCSYPAPVAEIYDPEIGESEPLSLSGELPELAGGWSSQNASIAPLPSGEVLITSSAHDPRFAAILDPLTGYFRKLADMPVGRTHGHSSVLSDGRILIFGGTADRARTQAQTQTVIFDPADRSFSLGPAQVVPRLDPAVALLADGGIFISGGRNPGRNLGEEPRFLKSAEIFDPATGEFHLISPPSVGREDALATQLSDGRILVTGGSRWVGSPTPRGPEDLRFSEIYDPATGEFVRTGNTRHLRPWASLAALPDGQALLVGGQRADSVEVGVWSSVEIFKPEQFNFKVRIYKVVRPARTLKAGKKFKVVVHLRNQGRGIARGVEVCLYRGWFGSYRTLKCPRKFSIKPGATRRVVVKASFRSWQKRLVKKNIRVIVKAHGDRLRRVFPVRVRS